MKHSIFILASIFPYGKSEPYLEEELNYISRIKNSRIVLFSLSPRKGDVKKKMPSNVEINPIFFKGYFFYFLHSLTLLFDTKFYKEFFKLLKSKKLTFRKFIKLTTYLSQANYEYKRIKKLLKKKYHLPKESTVVFYSYRLEYQAYILYSLRSDYPNCKFIARAHRYDLYEEFSKAHYLPFQEDIITSLDDVITISKDGFKYLKDKYPFADNISLRYLGTKDYLLNKDWKKNPKKIKIISCSNITPIKRVELIAQSLYKISENIEIEWVHYGDGENNSKVKLETEIENLPSNIKVYLPGYIDSSALMEIYKNQDFDIFVNVSTSEGIPVSIMEATSFGIPIIATDVGGTSEIVKDGYNGFLLESDFSTGKLSELIIMFYKMNECEYLQFRNNSREIWEEFFSAEKNYLDFCIYLQNLI